MQPADFQLEDGKHMASMTRAFNMSDLGTGKTISAIVGIEELRQEAIPLLIVCPNSVKLKWQRELAKWLDIESAILGGKARKHEKALLQGLDANIINYEALRLRVANIAKKEWGLVIFDESHIIKNRKTEVTKRSLALKRANYIWLMTGNPAPVGIQDLWSQLRQLFPEGYTSYWRFLNTYAELEKTAFGTEIVGIRDLDGLVEELLPFSIKRLTEDVLPDLSPLQIQAIPLAITPSQRRTQKLLEKEFCAIFDDTLVDTTTTLAQHTRMRQLAVYPELIVAEPPKGLCPKFDYIVSLCTSYPQEPFIIYSSFATALDYLDELLVSKGIQVLSLRGGGQAGHVAERFQEGEARVLTATIDAVRDGLDLFRSRYAFFLDIPFTWAKTQGGIKRLHRWGQERSVIIQFLLTEDTVDNDLFELVVERCEDWRTIQDKLAERYSD